MFLLDEACDQFGIYPICFGAIPHGPGIVPGVQWIEQEYGIALCMGQIGQ